jgi:octaprenyl-diphosphate synthase
VLALVSEPMQTVETRLLAQMDSPIGRIPDVGGHLLGAGGKRLRPLLAVLASRATNAPLDAAIAVGCAAEFIHTATLFHDDVVDGGAVRRGRPAARMVYGNGIAVLVGDFCFARGLEAVAATGSLAAVEALAAAVTEMAEGEVAQLEGAGDPEATADGYFDVIDRKTGALMAWCARVGGLLSGPLDACMARYGRLLGRAFQITDDVLDCAGDETSSGKSPGRDLQEGKLTLPVLLACQARPALRDDIRSAMGPSGVSPEDAARIMQATRAEGGLDRARAEAMALARNAVAELQAVPPSSFRDALAALAHLSVERVA